MRRPRPLPPSDFDWRDPNMPVIGKSGRAIDPSKYNLLCTTRMQQPNEPKWDRDPSYNWRKQNVVAK